MVKCYKVRVNMGYSNFDNKFLSLKDAKQYAKNYKGLPNVTGIKISKSCKR